MEDRERSGYCEDVVLVLGIYGDWDELYYNGREDGGMIFREWGDGACEVDCWSTIS